MKKMKTNSGTNEHEKLGITKNGRNQECCPTVAVNHWGYTIPSEVQLVAEAAGCNLYTQCVDHHGHITFGEVGDVIPWWQMSPQQACKVKLVLQH